MQDEVTQSERAAYRPVVLRTKRTKGQFVLSPHIMWNGCGVWYVGVWVGWWQIGFIMRTRRAYERSLLALGPWRNG